MFRKRNQRPRCFAQLDASGRCQAFWMLQQPPSVGNWLEVSDAHPHWIGKQLHQTGASSGSAQPSRD